MLGRRIAGQLELRKEFAVDTQQRDRFLGLELESDVNHNWESPRHSDGI
jgi:hypothetical protein